MNGPDDYTTISGGHNNVIGGTVSGPRTPPVLRGVTVHGSDIHVSLVPSDDGWRVKIKSPSGVVTMPWHAS